MNISNVLNLKNILFGIGIFAVVIAMLGFSGKLPGFTDKAIQNQFSGNVVIWGTIPFENIQDTLDLFNKNVAKTYIVNYKEIAEENLTNKLTQNLADGISPDLILAPYSYILANEKRLAPISNKVISEIDYRNTFADQSAILFSNGGYLGMPISIDPLVLYYNRDLLSSSGIVNPPATWEKFFEYENKITRFYENKNIKISTVPFGTYRNIPHITDIVMAMIMQLGDKNPIQKSYGNDANGKLIAQFKVNLNQDLSDPEAEAGSLNTVLLFMKNFADTQKESYTWNNNIGNALSEFISGNLAFYIGYASELGYIKNANQKLYFDYTYIPQVADTNISTTYGRMYTLSILKTSPNASAAYNTMISLSTGAYSSFLSGATGGISPLKSILSTPSANQASIIFGRSALISKGFQDLYRNQLEHLMKQAIENVYSGSKTTVEAAKEFVDNLQQVYNNK